VTTNPQHSAVSVEWGTPPEILEMGRHVLGGDFDLDPATSAYWNSHHVRAARFFDAAADGLKQDWGPMGGRRIVCNPPGGLVAPFWKRCFDAYRAGASVWWVGFSLEQMVYLQRHRFFKSELHRCIPPRRISFLRGVAERPQQALFAGPPPTAPEEVDSPTHGNYLVLMPETEDQITRFRHACWDLGAEVF
jgi:hypothetical protein